MFKIGLKLWSTNKQYIQEAQRLYDDGFCHYIELFAVPGSFHEYGNLWKQLNTPFIIHAAHFTQGLNFAKPENAAQNKKMAAEAFRFADTLNAGFVIFHPGVEGDIKETVRQLKDVYDVRMVIENKPYCSYDGKFVCNGYSPEEIKFVLEVVDIGFCMDIAHAIYAANSKTIDQIKYLKDFLALSPQLFHLADGDWCGVFDSHEHLGKGCFDFSKICPLLPYEAMVTLECKHDSDANLIDFEREVDFLNRILGLTTK